MKNNTWNLQAGDCRLNADSSFTIEEGEFAEITAMNVGHDEKIVILKIIRPPECSDMDAVGFIPKANCAARMELTSENGYHARIGSWGEYLISRMTSPCGKEIRSENASVYVEKHKLTKGIAPLDDKGFC